MLKRHLLFVFICGNMFSLYAEQPEKERYALTTSISTLGIGSVRVLEPYLSPFEYNGYQIRLQSNSRRYFTPENDKLSYSQRFYLDGGIVHHPNSSNAMQLFNSSYTFGINRHFRPFNGLMVLAGASWDIHFGGKYLPRNVNNPFALDLFSNINAQAEVQYILRLWKHTFRIQYGFQTPLIGYMFVPTQGITYYEMFVLNNLQNTFHLSWPYNKQAWEQYLHIDIPLMISTLRLSVLHNAVRYTAHNTAYHRNGWLFSVGYLFDFYRFSGNKRKIPANFIRAYE